MWQFRADPRKLICIETRTTNTKTISKYFFKRTLYYVRVKQHQQDQKQTIKQTKQKKPTHSRSCFTVWYFSNVVLKLKTTTTDVAHLFLLFLLSHNIMLHKIFISLWIVLSRELWLLAFKLSCKIAIKDNCFWKEQWLRKGNIYYNWADE